MQIYVQQLLEINIMNITTANQEIWKCLCLRCICFREAGA